MRKVADLDDTDRRIALYFQDGLPLTHAPFQDCAAALGLDEAEVIERLRRLKDANVVTRIGPFFNAERMGGDFCLCAMEVPDDLWTETVVKVNAFIEVAHNYRRDHALNMWFVLAVEHAADVESVARRIEEATGLAVFLFPKLREFFLEMKVPS
jgi:siroheme decarboxylase